MTNQKPSSPSVNSLDGRVGTIESEISRQSAEGRALRTDVERLTQAFEGFARDVRMFMQSTGRLDMRLVATFIGIGLSAVALTLTIGGMYLAPTNERVRANDASISDLEARSSATAASRWTEGDQDAFESEMRRSFADTEAHLDRHEALAGHPMALERTAQNAAAIVKLDETLQREMRLLDDALQREMRMLLDGPMETLQAVSSRLEKAEALASQTHDWGMLHEAQVSSLNANQTERIEEARRELVELARLIEKNADAFTEHTSNGHPASVMSHVDTLADRLDDLSDGIQARQEWLMEANAAMAARDAGYHARIEELERQIREISSEQRRRTEKVYATP